MTPDSSSLAIWLPAVRVGSGVDVFVERLAAGLEAAGHRALVQWFPHRMELTPWRLRSVPVPAGVDLVHATSWQGYALARPGLPLVVTEHNFVGDPAFAPYRRPAQSLYHRAFILPRVRRSYRAADALVAVSHYTAGVIAEVAGRQPDVVHNWVDVERFTPRPAPPREGRPFRLLFVGNPSRWKGSDLLPRIAQALGPGVELRCLGGLRKGVEAAGLPNMHRLAPVPAADMPAVYADADAVLVPARYEAFGYVALEAMACGKPVVAFAGTGTSEVCRDGQTALLAPREDVEALVSACRRLVADPALCARLGAAGRQRAVDHFTVERGVAGYLSIYRRVLANRRPAGGRS